MSSPEKNVTHFRLAGRIIGMSGDGFLLFRWPDGWVWRGALAMGRRLRRERLATFLRRFRLGAASRVLDVGATTTGAGACNFIEEEYPWPGMLTACGLEGAPEICRRRGIAFVSADGCSLPFEDKTFDAACCNAVIEHAGSRARQKALVAELCRVGRSVWIATPDAAGPFEPHTLLPFVHWLPTTLRNAVYRATGRGFWTDEANLNPLDAGALRSLFPAPLQKNVEIRRQYLLGLPTILIAILNRK
ncbi:MAG: class I SAM-dependent methyltransferase [Phycisphaerae bacterium]|nr:class I SAM-dependent methyltransferase [Phycisphaerae bacterium]